MWGKLYHYFHLKLWVLIAIGVFEVRIQKMQAFALSENIC